MILYILKSSLCLLLLWAFYKLFLEKENIHYIKRFYLLFSLVFAFLIPFITFTYEIEVPAQSEVVLDITTPLLVQTDEVIIEEPVDYLPSILWSLYGIGLLIFGFRFIRNIKHISRKIRTSEHLEEASHINVLINTTVIPHTFLDYIFVSKKEFQEKNIPEEVLLHEKTHVLQKHTLDILFVEVLQVIFWFNPLFIFMKKSIKLNHEFLADQNVLKQHFSIQKYVDLLLTYPNSPNQAVVSSPINYSLTKKRLQMMTKEFSKKRVTLKLMALVPLLVVCLLFFNNEIVAKEVTITPTETTYLKKASLVLQDEEKNNSIDESQQTIQDGVTVTELEEYNRWATEFKRKQKEEKGFTVSSNEVEKMRTIYLAMTSAQKKQTEKFPEILPPRPAKVSKVNKLEKRIIPTPPSAPEPPKDVPDVRDIDINIEEEVETRIEEMMAIREEAQIREMEAMKEAELQRDIAMEEAELAQEEANIHAELLARKANRKTEIKSKRTAIKAQLEPRKAAAKAARDARRAEIEAKRAAIKAQLEPRKAAIEAKRRAVMDARKEAIKAHQEAYKVAMIARKEAIRSRPKPVPHSELIRKMDTDGTEFYYKGKRISYKEAKRIMETSNNLSINTKTKNGKTKVKIKN